MLRITSLVLAVLFSALTAQAEEDCMKCHSNRAEMIKALKGKPLRRESLLLDNYQKCVHKQKGCGECHFDYETFPHDDEAETAQCSECHEDAAEVHKTSIHANAEPPVTCMDCHGLHNIVPPSERESTLFPLNVHETCGKCHFANGNGKTRGTELTKDHYMADAHGHGILDSGLIVSATCVSCHGKHDIQKGDHEKSPVNRQNVENTCGKCHVRAYEQHKGSVHDTEATGGKGATCTDCHHPHEMRRSDADFLTQSVESCGKCHEDYVSTFRNTFHGKSTALGGKTATCNECHGNHKILPTDNPLSTVNAANVVDTCAKCHEGSHESFASYLVHADPTDKENYPKLWWVWMIMTSLLVGTLILGCAHALLWLIRATAAGEWKRPKPGKAVMRYIRRWPASYVVYHMMMMTVVLFLSMTGLPIYFSDMEWAQTMMGWFGGLSAAGYVHRVMAVGLGILFVIYIGHLVLRVARKEKGLFFGPDSMTPRFKDMQDLWGNIKWFLFLAPRPKYDRWTYWEKFDFWAAFWGLFVIGVTGLMLWFPVATTKLVPGWFLNAAAIIHGIEALLDIAFIFSVHVFHANLRPDKFPMDTMFLHGVISEDEFKHERPAEYERMVKEGKLEALLADKPSRRRRITAYVIGTCALAIGFFFVGAMIVAVLQKWA